MTGFYRSMISNYAQLAAPLEAAVKNNVFKKSFTLEEFNRLKRRFTKDLRLGILDVHKPWVLYTDLSGIQAGAVVVQDNKVCRAFSKKFNESQVKYPVTRKEALAVLWATMKFYHLMNEETTVYTDHQPLANWLSSTGGNDLLLDRWALKLQEYPIRIQ